MTTATTRTLTVTIDAPFTAVVSDLADPLAHPQWGTEFFAGPAMACEEPGEPLPLRVVPNCDGADVLFTLARAAGMPDPAWNQAVSSMGRELGQLKARLEAAVQA